MWMEHHLSIHQDGHLEFETATAALSKVSAEGRAVYNVSVLPQSSTCHGSLRHRLAEGTKSLWAGASPHPPVFWELLRSWTPS